MFNKIKNFLTSAKESKVYPNYLTALESSNQSGYNNSKLAAVISEKTRNLISQFNSLDGFSDTGLMRLSYLLNSKIVPISSVVDFGGGFGVHFISLSKTKLMEEIDQWIVVETSTVVNLAENLNSKLHFVESISNCSTQPDLFYSNSAIQYVEDIYSLISEVLLLNPKIIYIARTPFNLETNLVVSKQRSKLSKNGPGSIILENDEIIEYPITYFPIDELNLLINHSYKLIWKEQTHAGPFEHGKCRNAIFDLIFERR